jgi:hypothetical protein
MGKAIDRGRQKGGAAVWTALALVGAAALTYVVVRRFAGGGELPDADTLLAAADEAANNLDAILMAEGAIAG